MDWENKILAGMELIKEGCEENELWSSCFTCPFDDYCNMLLHGSGNLDITPDSWVVERKSEKPTCGECKYFDACGSLDRDEVCNGFEKRKGEGYGEENNHTSE